MLKSIVKTKAISILEIEGWRIEALMQITN